MGVMAISLDSQNEDLLRTIAKERFGGKKGAISDAVIAGLKLLWQDLQRERAINRLVKSMEKGASTAMKGQKKPYTNRDEIYADRIANCTG